MNFRVVVTILAIIGTGACAAQERANELKSPRLLHDARDYFALSAALARMERARDPEVEYLRASVEHARNRPARSNEIIGRILAGRDIPDTLAAQLERLRYRNLFRMGQYASALEALEAALSHALSADDRRELENEAKIAAALRGTPPQRVMRRAESVLERLPNTRVPVAVEGRRRAYVLDTGANLSVLMRSEADSLGLQVRPVGVEVRSVTGGSLEADIAVAEEVVLGDVTLSHVVFLVVPDEMLTFAGGEFTIPGILGFPVLEALGEVAFRGRESLRIAGNVPERPVWNLALDNLTLLVRVIALDDTVACVLDTGASKTNFYHSFYTRHQERIRSLGRPDSVRFAGAGGVVAVEAFVLPELRLELADTVTTGRAIPVYVGRLSEDEPEFRACNLGLDVLWAFEEYVLNFRSMTFLLR
jgi:predicted aspartyl protease